MECREKCGACCIEPSISTSIPGMLEGKKAGVSCVQLDEDNRCKIFGKEGRPDVCKSLKPSKEMCKNNAQEARAYLKELERLTTPDY